MPPAPGAPFPAPALAGLRARVSPHMTPAATAPNPHQQQATGGLSGPVSPSVKLQGQPPPHQAAASTRSEAVRTGSALGRVVLRPICCHLCPREDPAQDPGTALVPVTLGASGSSVLTPRPPGLTPRPPSSTGSFCWHQNPASRQATEACEQSQVQQGAPPRAAGFWKEERGQEGGWGGAEAMCTCDQEGMKPLGARKSVGP